MKQKQLYTLIIDQEFRDLISPLSREEWLLLEANLKANGCMSPIVVWKNTIIDGHNRYEICTKHGIPFEIKELQFSSKEEACIWICDNQLGRRNLSDEAKKYLIGKRYEIEKNVSSIRNSSGVNQYSSSKDQASDDLSASVAVEVAERKQDTANRIGNEYSISKSTVMKYGRYSKAIDHIADVDPSIRPKILSGQCKVSHAGIMEMSQMDDDDIIEVSRKLQQPRKTFVPYSASRQHIQEENNRCMTLGIKQMPAPDPDAEITSLILTIPSWVNSINRISTTTNFDSISKVAKSDLEDSLLSLQIAVEELMEAVEKA